MNYVLFQPITRKTWTGAGFPLGPEFKPDTSGSCPGATSMRPLLICPMGAKLKPSRKKQQEATMALPEVGSTPSGFTLANQDGADIALADYAGNNVLVWFYPRAFGGG